MVIGDTIWAVASPEGSAPRGVIRISGPQAFAAVARVWSGGGRRTRGAWDGELELAGLRVPALVVTMPGPGSFTGEDVVELHLPGSPLLLERVGDALRPVARPAAPGEFSRRAFENGRLTLEQAEAVLDLILAEDVEQARRAAAIVTGTVREAVAVIRDRIDAARARLEAGLDFEEGETGEVPSSAWACDIEAARDRLGGLVEQLPRSRPGGELVLLGAANAGKSSLCNALAGEDAVLVSDVAGTTRDVVVVELGGGLRLLDAPGDVDAAAEDVREVLAHRDRRIGEAAVGGLLVVDPTAPHPVVSPSAPDLPLVAVVLTRGDRIPQAKAPDGIPTGVPVFVVGCPDGSGIEELRRFLARRVAGGPRGGGVRLASALARAVEALDRSLALGDGPGEIVAVELADATSALDEVDGSTTPEDLLDRIFARFCLGK